MCVDAFAAELVLKVTILRANVSVWNFVDVSRDAASFVQREPMHPRGSAGPAEDLSPAYAESP